MSKKPVEQLSWHRVGSLDELPDCAGCGSSPDPRFYRLEPINDPEVKPSKALYQGVRAAVQRRPQPLPENPVPPVDARALRPQRTPRYSPRPIPDTREAPVAVPRGTRSEEPDGSSLSAARSGHDRALEEDSCASPRKLAHRARGREQTCRSQVQRNGRLS